ncbi:MAG: ABC transporter ATP-binding protein/permease [Flavobacteriales bacterium]|nr:ABC transporter ATP-binding protein/permease [Flavobacteriales bacterium]
MTPYNGKFYWALFLTLFLAVISIFRPKIIGELVGQYVANKDKEGLLIGTLIVVGLLIIEAIGSYYRAYISQELGQNVIRDIRNQVFSHITQLKLHFFDNTPLGRLVTRVISDIETIADIFSQGFIMIIGDILTIIFVIGTMLYLNWELTLIVIIPIPLLLWATKIFKNAIKKAFQDVRNEVSKLNTYVQEHITGINIVKIFNREAIEIEKFEAINQKHRAAHIKSVWAYSIFFPVVENLSALSIALLIFYSLFQINEPNANIQEIITDLTSFILFVHMLYRPIRMLADKFNTLQMGLVGAERVFNLLDTQEFIHNPTSSKETVDFNQTIEFKNLWFAYNSPNYVLKDITFSVNKGETVAIVGATGAGKSSIINLLSRFYEYQKGEILIDGSDLRTIDSNTIRTQIAVVLQEVFLYSDSIFNNITLGNPNISKEEVIAASKLVGTHQFIMNLPNAYDFNVKEGGGMLSVGQRQLISFLRAYVYNPTILILDEATSSIDSESEEMIQNAIDKLTEGRTSIIIAHRLSTIKKATKIIVLEKGEIKEIGNHHELIKNNGYYKKLYDTQFNEQ